MTPTDLELRRMVAEKKGWRVEAEYTGGVFCWNPGLKTERQILPQLPHWAWPCLLELADKCYVLIGASGYVVCNAYDRNCELASDPDPARAVVLAWLKFKESNRSAERAGR